MVNTNTAGSGHKQYNCLELCVYYSNKYKSGINVVKTEFNGEIKVKYLCKKALDRSQDRKNINRNYNDDFER